MRRRDFVKTTTVASIGVATGISLKQAASATTLARYPAAVNLKSAAQQHRFKLDYAPHFGMFRNSASEELLDQIRFMHDQGFRSLEDNSMRERPAGEQEAIGRLLEQLDMRMGVFVANSNGFGVPSFTSGKEEHRAQFLTDCLDSVEVAQRVNAKWMTVVMGDLSPRLEIDYQTANAIESLRRAAEIFEPHGLIMVLEPLNPYTDHPGMFLSKIPHAHMICRAVDSPSCKILFDIYHQQITEGKLIDNLHRYLDQIGHIHTAGVPGRHELLGSENDYAAIFRAIDASGYDGYVGLEFRPTIGEEAALAQTLGLL